MLKPASLPRRRARAGMTLVEIMIVLIILGIIGTALTKLLLQQGRSFSAQQAQRNARIVSRNALGIMLGELRMAQDVSAIDSVGADGSAIRIELPYALGISCGTVGAATVVRFATVDSVVQATALPNGFRWRQASDGVWQPRPAGTFSATVADVGQRAACAAAQIGSVTVHGDTGAIMALQPAVPIASAPAGTPIFLSQKVVYRFAPSTAYAQGLGLYRQVIGGSDVELLGPFHSSSRFNYYLSNNLAATAVAPATLGDIRGLELVLNGLSEKDAPNLGTGRVGQVVSRVRTGVMFKNTRSY